MRIVSILGREVLDSRGNPTVEVDVLTESVHLDARLFHRVHRQVKTKHWNCAMATKRDTLVKAC